MGLRLFASILLLTLSFESLAFEHPNTDEYFVYDFIRKMGTSNLSETNNTSFSICSWRGVSCDTRNGSVINLMVSGMGLSGYIPENTLGKLSKLQHLDLSSNNITGFSSDLWGLGSSLKSLNLSFNKITGMLPNNIGNFGILESLDISYNDLLGDLPSALGSLSNLRLLNISRNRFAGTIPNGFLGCKSLVEVDLSLNGFNSTLPENFGTILGNLTYLNLGGNMFYGRLPDLSMVASLTYLNASGNLFEGSLLGVFRKPLQVVDMSNNHFQGLIPQITLNSGLSMSDLVYLDLSGNQLTWEFVNELYTAQSLKHLNFADNRFSQQNFPSMEKLSNLEYLNLSRTNLTGSIPAEFSQLIMLATVDLSQNDLSGHIPELSMKNLSIIDFSENNFTGEIPLSLQQKLPNLLKFNFSYNHLTFCAKNFSPEVLKTAFLGSQNDCPIAANPNLLRTKEGKHKVVALAFVIAISVLFIMLGLVCLAFGCRRKNRQWATKKLPCKEEQHISGPFSFQTDSTTWVADVTDATLIPVVIFDKPLLKLSFADLLSATSHFDKGTLLAEGRFGPVYRGSLPGGFQAAIKVLVYDSTLTDCEATRELERYGRIKHPNLVSLIGYCLAGEQRIIIYEYMDNGNLQNLLHDLPLGIQTTEDWSTDTWEEDNNRPQSITSDGQSTWRIRHKIALGTARALAFLHHGCSPQIIHKDVKASSIYLDIEFEPRLSNSGLANIVGTNCEDTITHGSAGYSPPECSQIEICSASTKSDVYAYGIILFQLVTGKKPLGDDYPDAEDTSLVTWVRGLVRKNQCSRAVDPKIQGFESEKQMEEALRIGYLCTADLPSKRPSMQQIVGLLKDIEPLAANQ